jgi:hypothetical protein
VTVLNPDEPPVAEDLYITVYSGRTTNFSLPAYDPDGKPVELFIITEPQGGVDKVKLSSEKLVSVGGLRRKVRDALNDPNVECRMSNVEELNGVAGLQGLNPLTFYAPDEVVPDYGLTFRHVGWNQSGLCLLFLRFESVVPDSQPCHSDAVTLRETLLET